MSVHVLHSRTAAWSREITADERSLKVSFPQRRGAGGASGRQPMTQHSVATHRKLCLETLRQPAAPSPANRSRSAVNSLAQPSAAEHSRARQSRERLQEIFS